MNSWCTSVTIRSFLYVTQCAVDNRSLSCEAKSISCVISLWLGELVAIVGWQCLTY